MDVPLRLFAIVLVTVALLCPRAVTAEDRLDPDRPHLPEASTTVGQGRAVLESGYTFSERGSSRTYSYPETLLRVGMVTDWFEVRVGQNFVTQDRTVSNSYVGAKIAIVEHQRQYLPQLVVIPQMTVASESRPTVSDRVLPGLNIDASWEVIEHLFNVELLVAANRVRDDVGGAHVQVATGLTAVVNVRRDLEVFAEWDAFYAASRATSGGKPRDYAVGGLVYFLTKNLALDLRAGVGLNKQANDFLTGPGFSVRY